MLQATTIPVSGTNGVKAPRGIAVVAGQTERFRSFSVEQNAFNAADTFTLRLPFFIRDSAGQNPVLAIDPNTASALVNQDLVPVQLYVGYPPDPNQYSASDLTLVMDGTMDTARWRFSKRGETVTLCGRNKTGALIDTDVVDKFPNMTASAIAQKFAREHGLQAQISPTQQLAGTYYNQQASMISSLKNEWDLLLFLAKNENFVARVRANTLYFGPYGTVTSEDNTGSPLLLTYGYNIEELDLERSPHAARDIQVTVLSYNRDNKQRIKAAANSNTQGAKKITGQLHARGKYNLVYKAPGLTKAQAQNLAQKILDEASRSQIIGNLTTAGIPDAVVDRQITLAGLGAGLDQSYYLNKVVHRFGLEGYKLEASFSAQTDYTQDDLGDSSPLSTSGNSVLNPGSVNSILSGANSINGTRYWANACAVVVNRVLTAAGINVSSMGVANTAYAPDYQSLGQTITNPANFQPGDLVLTNWGPDQNRGGQFDFGHIGIYAGNGMFWNVSSSNGYKWVQTPLPAGKIQAQRL